LSQLEAADAIPDNVVDVRPPPIIQSVSTGMKIGVGIASGFCSLCALATFVFILVNRNHAVMQLAQWQFMAWLLLSCLVTNVFVFTYMPTKDWHCRWSDLLQSIPLTMLGTILIGRSWRVYITISAASSIGLRRKSETNPTTSDKVKKVCVGLLSFIAAFPYNVCSKNKEEISQRDSGFRKKVSAAETTRLIMWLTLPQIILQILGVFIVNRKVKTDFNEMMSVGRDVCDESGEWIRRIGAALSAAAFATAVLLAWVNRDLPSAFNETDSVFQAATINTIVGLLAMSLDQVASSARTPPDVSVFLWTATTLIVSWTTVGFIVGPKLMRVLSGEKFVISNLLSQEKQSTKSHSHQTDNNGASTPRPSSTLTRAPIHLRRSEAIPRKLEQNMLGVSKLLVGVRHEL
jgi:7 transmembrane sweet-taste receptor of 3 GCPR